MESMESMLIYNNQFTGSLPIDAVLNKLKEFYAINNKLTGTIPSWIERASQLEYLGLGHNFLNGTIPQFIFDLPMLSDGEHNIFLTF